MGQEPHLADSCRDPVLLKFLKAPDMKYLPGIRPGI